MPGRDHLTKRSRVFRSTAFPIHKNLCLYFPAFGNLLGQLSCTSAEQSSLLKTPSLIAIELYPIANNFNVINAQLSSGSQRRVYQDLILKMPLLHQHTGCQFSCL